MSDPEKLSQPSHEQLKPLDAATSPTEAVALWWTHAISGKLGTPYATDADGPQQAWALETGESERQYTQGKLTPDQLVLFAEALQDELDWDVILGQYMWAHISARYDAPSIFIRAGERVGLSRRDMDRLTFMLGRTDWNRYQSGKENVEATLYTGGKNTPVTVWPNDTTEEDELDQLTQEQLTEIAIYSELPGWTDAERIRALSRIATRRGLREYATLTEVYALAARAREVGLPVHATRNDVARRIIEQHTAYVVATRDLPAGSTLAEADERDSAEAERRHPELYATDASSKAGLGDIVGKTVARVFRLFTRA